MQVLEQEVAAANGVEHPVSKAEQDGYELAHQVARSDSGAQASSSGRSSAEPEGEVLLELHNVHKAFGSKRILQVCKRILAGTWEAFAYHSSWLLLLASCLWTLC